MARYSERIALDDAGDDRVHPVAVRRRVLQDLADRRHVVVLEAAAQRIGQQLLGQRVHEALGPRGQRRAQLGDAVELAAVGQRAGRVDRVERLVDDPPLAGRVEVLEREAGRVDHRVAGGAGRVVAVLRHPLAHRRRPGLRPLLRQRRHVRRRIGRRRAEDVVEDPLAANHRRGPDRGRGHRQDAAVAEQAAARAVGRQRDAAEVAALHAGDAVVPREPLVQERVVRREHLDRRRFSRTMLSRKSSVSRCMLRRSVSSQLSA